MNPLIAYQHLLLGALGGIGPFTQVLVRTTPVLLISLGTIVAFRAGIWNIGQEGQFYMGALTATITGIAFFGLPTWLFIPLLICTGFLGGAIWSGLVGIMKAKFGADEVISSLMLNFIAVLVIDFLVTGQLRDPESRGNPISPLISPGAYLPILLPGTRLHAGVLVALLAIPLVYLLLFRSVLGYQIRAVGFNPRAARYGGMDVSRIYLLVMIMGGGLAGVAGSSEIAGVHHRLFVGISPGFGGTGIIAALLGKLHPFGALFASVFYAIVFIGADEMARSTGISTFLVFVLQGVIILAVLATDRLKIFERRVRHD